MLFARSLLPLLRVSLVAAPALLLSAHASAQITAPFAATKLKVIFSDTLQPHTCGQPFKVQLTITNEGPKFDGHLLLRGDTTPISYPKGGGGFPVALAGAYDCAASNLGATVGVFNGTAPGGSAKNPNALFSRSYEAKTVTYTGGGQKNLVTGFSGYIAITMPVATCGQPLKATVLNMLTKPDGSGLEWKLKVGGNGVAKDAIYPPSSQTPVELGTLDCKKGAPNVVLSGGIPPVTMSALTVGF
jgi:hypothetical protein